MLAPGQVTKLDDEVVPFFGVQSPKSNVLIRIRRHWEGYWENAFFADYELQAWQPDVEESWEDLRRKILYTLTPVIGSGGRKIVGDFFIEKVQPDFRYRVRTIVNKILIELEEKESAIIDITPVTNLPMKI